MGSGASKQVHGGGITARQVYYYSKEYDMTVSEVYYCFLRYHELLHLELDQSGPSHQDSNKSPNEPTPTSPKMRKKELVQEKHRLHTEIMKFGLSEQLKMDWLLARVFSTIFPNEKVEDITFSVYLKSISWWRRQDLAKKLEYYNQDGVISVSDITVFIQQILHYQFKVGDPVGIRTDDRTGILRYLDETQFAAGIWAGIELDSPSGKHDGNVKNVQYFKCEPQHGVFVPFENIELLEHRFMATNVLQQLVDKQTQEINFPTFYSFLSEDPWINSLLNHDILPLALTAT